MENSIYLRSVPLVLEDHGNKLLKGLYEQQKKSQLCDLSLVVENVSFPAHKCVLAAYSGYFGTLFDQGKQSDNAGSKACNVTTIHLSSTNLSSFVPILHYLYTSKLHVFSENIRDVMRTARKLQIHSVLNACEKLLDDNVTLASIRKVGEKQSSDTIVTQSNLSESVMYVDLRSEEDDSYVASRPALAENYSRRQSTGSIDNQVFQQPSLDSTLNSGNDSSASAAKRTHSVDTEYTTQTSQINSLSSKQKVARSQKKGFPKKVLQRPTSEPQTSPSSFYNMAATVSPASIFGRVTSSPPSRSRNTSSVTSPDALNKSSSSTFEASLDPLGAVFGADSALMTDSVQMETSSAVKTSEKSKTTTQSKSTTDSIQLHSVFSMSQASTQPSTVSTGEISFAPNINAVVSSIFTAPSIPVLQNSLAPTPSVYTCKECFKYFTNLSEAIHHFYSEHQSSATSSNTSPAKLKPSSYTCPHCSRVFNNKNNLKRHILIKHTSDKRFKCPLCGRRYAIRQSLQYHMKSAHGVNDMRDALLNMTPATSTYQFEPVSETCTTTIDSFSFSSSVTNTVSSFLDTFQPISNPSLLSPAAYLNSTTATEAVDELPFRTESQDASMPMIESIRSVASDKGKLLPRPQLAGSRTQKERKIAKNFLAKKNLIQSTKSLRNPPAILPNLHRNPPEDLSQPSRGQVSSVTQQDENRQNTDVSLRLHRCDYCSRIFSTIHAYTRHKRTCHKHECPICHRGFSQLGNMRRHIKIFHCEAKPYECHICHKAYGLKQSFRYHMRDKHGSELPPHNRPRNITPKP